MDYLCYKVETAAAEIRSSRDPLRHAFGVHLEKVAKALHDIEWVDSCDSGPGDEHQAIREVLGQHAELEQLIEDAGNVCVRLEKALREAKP
jgi:hypothetical protein